MAKKKKKKKKLSAKDIILIACEIVVAIAAMISALKA